MTVYVLDASAGWELLSDSKLGRAIEAELEVDGDWWVPEHYFVEVLSIIRRAVRSGELPPEKADRIVARLSDADFSQAALQPMVPAIWELRDNVTPYDAPYVVLARHLGATLVSTDFKLRGAPGVGVKFIPRELP